MARRLAAVSVVKNGLPVPVDLQRRHNARVYVERLESILQGQCVHDRRQHTHVIAGHPVHAGAREPGPPEDVASADNDRDFYAVFPRGRDFTGNALDGPGLDAVIQLTHQRLAAQFEQHTPVWTLGVTHIHAFSLSLPKPPPGER
jgi:hypothetical protein